MRTVSDAADSINTLARDMRRTLEAYGMPDLALHAMAIVDQIAIIRRGLPETGLRDARFAELEALIKAKVTTPQYVVTKAGAVAPKTKRAKA